MKLWQEQMEEALEASRLAWGFEMDVTTNKYDVWFEILFMSCIL